MMRGLFALKKMAKVTKLTNKKKGEQKCSPFFITHIVLE